jgi:NADPH:quinone reductase-like Zn-dependent oxidoreductase
MVSITGAPTAAFAREQGLGLGVQLAAGAMGLPTALRASRRGVTFTYLFMRASGAQLEKLAELCVAGTVKPVVDQTFPLERAAEALAYVEAGKAKGKVVLTVGNRGGASA